MGFDDVRKEVSYPHPRIVTVFVVRDGKYLLLHRCGQYWNGIWQPVTGSVDKGEKAWEAAIREVKEESSLDVERLYSVGADHFYVASEDKMFLSAVFVAYVDEGAIELSPTEHDAYEWLDIEDALNHMEFTTQKMWLEAIHKHHVDREDSFERITF